MYYLTIILLIIASIAGLSATAGSIITHFKKDAHWAHDYAWTNAVVLKYSLLTALTLAILDILL